MSVCYATIHTLSRHLDSEGNYPNYHIDHHHFDIDNPTIDKLQAGQRMTSCPLPPYHHRADDDHRRGNLMFI
ncbi:hypothetical protein SCLCIDRAFT_1219881 [Scleroderma citrinum Foug A]|uniref:Uncharacterized protein n=1 Tax=Scleroderma citrinum Foug A TaxID=1036808 RepID=A0A0C3DLA0_9AGAM|nr:hypothetical protein SCLCIDRAFT_1224152 [Scleroderma citrinum Foug A]KIM57039.1 hypothetical protein SCLCIDRAFT_1219881 [Scleroderma citrinum Foug A]